MGRKARADQQRHHADRRAAQGPAEPPKPCCESIIQQALPTALEKTITGRSTYWSIKGVASGSRKRPGDSSRCPASASSATILADDRQHEAFQEAITAQTDPDSSLSDVARLQAHCQQVTPLPGGDAPAVSPSIDREGMRFWYEMATAEQTKSASRASRPQPVLRVRLTSPEGQPVAAVFGHRRIHCARRRPDRQRRYGDPLFDVYVEEE